MKTPKNTLKTIGKMMLLSAVFAFASCDKDDDNNNNSTIPAAGDYFLKAKVNGQDYSNSAYFAPTAAITNGVLTVQSSTDTGNSVQIRIENYNGVGTYDVGGDVTAGYVNYTTLNPFKAYTSVRGTGNVVITEVTEAHIKGNFAAYSPENQENATQAVTITEGDFKVKRQ